MPIVCVAVCSLAIARTCRQGHGHEPPESRRYPAASPQMGRRRSLSSVILHPAPSVPRRPPPPSRRGRRPRPDRESLRPARPTLPVLGGQRLLDPGREPGRRPRCLAQAPGSARRAGPGRRRDPHDAPPPLRDPRPPRQPRPKAHPPPCRHLALGRSVRPVLESHRRSRAHRCFTPAPPRRPAAERRNRGRHQASETAWRPPRRHCGPAPPHTVEDKPGEPRPPLKPQWPQTNRGWCVAGFREPV
jgi:hypothetical protein